MVPLHFSYFSAYRNNSIFPFHFSKMTSGRSRLLPTPTNVRNVEVKSNSGFNETSRDPDSTINALGPDLAVATTQVLDSLNEHERQIILDVLNRDEDVRQRHAAHLV